MMRKKLRSLWSGWIRSNFHRFEKHLKIHVLPANYHSPTPQAATLTDGLFDQRFSCTGLRLDGARQMQLLEEVLLPYLSEYTPNPNPGLSLLDDFVLYALIRSHKPARMIEIGSGYSTLTSLKALSKNREEGAPCQFTAIEPFPPPHIIGLEQEGFELIDQPVQALGPAYFQSCDLLFIDSSHICKIGSDVTMQILELVPQVPAQALIHWHDITLPHNYWKEWVKEQKLFWNETYMVHAFMLYNDSFQTLWAAQYLQTYHGEALQKAIPFFKPDKHRLSSFWIQRTRAQEAAPLPPR